MALPLPDPILEVVDKKSSPLGMLFGGAGMWAGIMAIYYARRPPSAPSREVAAPPPPAAEPPPTPEAAGSPRTGRGVRLGLSAARVRGPMGVSGGGGCLVGERDVVTCTRVVSAALGLEDGERPDEPVQVDFPLLGRAHEPITAEVAAWDGEAGVAVLRLAEPPPKGAQPARPVIADDHWGHSIRVLGFPGAHGGGKWAPGELRGRRGDGWIQVDDKARELTPGFSGAVVWDEELNALIGILTTDGSGAPYVIPADVLLRDLAAQAAAPAPYRGLEAFRESDAEVFFGRRQEVADLLERTSRPGVTVVYGSSGSGKSSLVMAGLVPRLRERACVVTVRPSHGRTPVYALAAALLPALEPDQSEAARMAELPNLAQALTGGGIVEVVQRVRARSGMDEVVLVIDQFEEIYTAAGDSDAFVSALLPLLRTPSAGVHTVLTVRIDYSHDVLAQLETAQLRRDASYMVTPLDRDQLREAVEGPARERGVAFEPGLVDRILDDAGDEPGQLPLVEFALTLLWERQSGGVLGHDAYQEIGGVTGALAAYAEQVWNEQLSPADHPHARSLLLRLVRQAPDHLPSCAELPQDALGDEQWRLGQELATTRLLVAAEDRQGVRTLRLAHESLITRWGRLKEWVEEDCEFRIWHYELRRAAERWSAEREPARLLGGTDLETAREWLRERPDDLLKDERAFIEASARGAARARRTWQVAVAAGVALVFVAVFLFIQNRNKEQEGQERLRAAAAQTLADRAEKGQANPDLAALQAVAAYRTDPGVQKAQRVLFDRYSDFAAAERLLAGSGVTSERILAAEDGGVVVQEESHGVAIWQPDGGSALPERITLSSPLAGTALSADGRVLAVATEEGVVELRRPRDRELLGTLEIPKGKALLALDPAGRYLAVRVAGSRTVRVWDLERRRARGVSLPGEAQTLQIADDGRLSASLGDGRLLVFEPGRSRPARTVRTAAVFAHDGRTVAGCVRTRDGVRVRSHDLTTGAKIADFPLTIRGCEGNVGRPGTLSHGGRLLCVEDVVIDLRAGRIIGAPATYTPSYVVTGRDGRWSIWAVGGPGLVRYPAARTLGTDPYAVRQTTVTDDGRHVVTYDGDGRLRVWDAASKLLVSERLAAPDSGSDPGVETRVVALTGRQEIAVIRAGSPDLTLMSVPDLRTIGSARLPAGSADPAPLSLHAAANGRLVVFAGGMLTVWDTGPLRQAFAGVDLSERIPTGATWDADQALVVLPNTEGTAALVIERETREVEHWDLTLGRATRSHLLPGDGAFGTVAASPDLARLITYSGTAGEHFTAWSLPVSGQPTATRPEGPSQGYIFDLLQLRKANPELRYNPAFSIAKIGDAEGTLTVFDRGRKLLYNANEASILSSAPDDWAAHVCAVLGGRSFTAAERAQLPPGTETAPCDSP